jgi:UDP-N-acetylmuramoyl-tripeptide--D-alanyl-D-alanine ligase
MKLSVVAHEIQGHLFGPDGDLPPVVIDSRKIQAGDFFVALKGENLDGHEYIAQAINAGAKAILAQRAPQTELEKNVTFIQVEDTTTALGLLGALWRKRFSIPVVGLTGSCGKTTVKGMIAAICQQQGKTLHTQGNLNNHIGLPLTLLRLDPSIEYAVIEMGANHAGEIAYLGRIAKPTIALITNVKPAHLQGFKTEQGVAQAKGEIYDILPANGIALVNVDEQFGDYWRTIIGDRKTITFGLKNEAMVYASDIHLQPFQVQFTLRYAGNQQQVQIPIPGEHTVINALAAAAAGIALGIALPKIVDGLQAFESVKGRLRRLEGIKGAWIFDDTYNANPGSMQAALEVLARCPGHTVFVMGDMGELGENTVTYHAQIGDFARQKGIQKLLAVGNLSKHAVEAFGPGALLYPDKQSLVNELREQMTAESVVLVKGSRSAGMEVIANALIAQEE